MSQINNLTDFQSAAHKIIENFRLFALRHDFSHLNLQILEHIQMDYFGQKSALKYTVKTIRQPDGSVILIPFVQEQLNDIYEALVAQAPGWTVVSQKDSIRLNPPLATTENKEKVVKALSLEMESTKVQLRQLRQKLLTYYKQNKLSDNEFETDKTQLENSLTDLNKELAKVFEEQSKRILRV